MRTVKRIVALFILAVSFGACEKIYHWCSPARFEYSFSKSKRIDTTRLMISDPIFEFYSFQINGGDKNVFFYTHRFKDCPDIADDEGTRRIIFEIPTDIDHFLLNDSISLVKSKCILSLACECYPSYPVLLKSGSIEGTKINTNTWKIKASLKVSDSFSGTIDFEQLFAVQ